MGFCELWLRDCRVGEGTRYCAPTTLNDKDNIDFKANKNLLVVGRGLFISVEDCGSEKEQAD
ncbi:MAG: hypothetical protein WC180_03665 [Candidatus Paceibacterota bacterium]|jgi:hypothetical protein